MMKRSLMITLCAVMAAAILVMTAAVLRVNGLRRELAGAEDALAVSMAAWQETDSRKVALQEELRTVEEDVREAELTISEAEGRIGTLAGQVDALQARQEQLTRVRDSLSAADGGNAQ